MNSTKARFHPIRFAKMLVGWYMRFRRDLPWRKTQDPYKIWISEIILQQTRVSQGLKYYRKFVKQFPSLPSLARASLDDVLKIWEGLGYYSRAIHLLDGAKDILKSRKGVFPDSYSEILKIKGVGKYTAAAISSFCFNEPKAVIDGNVIRFLSRYFGLRFDYSRFSSREKLQLLTENIMINVSHRITPSDINQALMEFGALQCVPGQPDCRLCPFSSSCHANLRKKVHVLPYFGKKKNPGMKYFVSYLISDQYEHILLCRRGRKSFWKSLCTLPFLECHSRVYNHALKDETSRLEESISVRRAGDLGKLSHAFSHFKLNIRVLFFDVQRFNKNSSSFPEMFIRDSLFNEYLWVPKADIQRYAFPAPMKKILIESRILKDKSY